MTDRLPRTPPAATPPIPDRHAVGRLRDAQRAAFILGLIVTSSLGIFAGCLRLFGHPSPGDSLQFPVAFGVSTLLLLAGSIAMNRALHFVCMERQPEFRGWLKVTAVLAALFMGIQSYGLLGMTPATRSPTETSLGVRPLVMTLAGLHVMHFFVATLFISVVLSRSIADRYDHEYHWGVTVCAWFWHLLGFVWMAILAVFAIAIGS
ncbi:Cytochrome c oxidase subunit 3 [Caulifigura coniformis]|uniref:Cytochrome c oxidase subunit 3 n=1 Tax=Caulifigura coniformis TaxID=2527983 RepID=A0A517S9B2_9PLAN|nr:cytochrome c oxidase subunit 3 [Caulifigura coniformis]QDT52715.1 Cytochrome c oxidase subunit 3 [Caulifigura coniformis]